jgi:hypothetical protein
MSSARLSTAPAASASPASKPPVAKWNVVPPSIARGGRSWWEVGTPRTQQGLRPGPVDGPTALPGIQVPAVHLQAADPRGRVEALVRAGDEAVERDADVDGGVGRLLHALTTTGRRRSHRRQGAQVSKR